MGAARRVYASIQPEGAGAVGADFKPERVSAPPLKGCCFAKMKSSSEVDGLRASAGFRDPMDQSVMDGSPVAQRIRANSVRAKQLGIVPKAKVKINSVNSFTRGRLVKDVSVGRKGVIIQASVGFTKKSRTPVHRIADKNGNSWLGKEKNLRVLD